MKELKNNHTILVTGGAGFIGSTLVKHLLQTTSSTIINVDSLTFSSEITTLKNIRNCDRYHFYEVDIADNKNITKILNKHNISAVMNLAAETHVDRSIDSPKDFIQTNVEGTFQLLEATRKYWNSLNDLDKKIFRFHHISTDEVYGDLDTHGNPFDENSPYKPNSPYSASKAASDHLVKAWGRTYGLPIIITNCSNNYGPYQFPEKLIPHIILNALSGNPLPVYGDGQHIRDWLHVADHASALYRVLKQGRTGETYNICGKNQISNLEVVQSICDTLQDEIPKDTGHYRDLIKYVEDRPGHDRRYAIDTSKIEIELGWTPSYMFYEGLRETVLWYLSNSDWWQAIFEKGYSLSRVGIIRDNQL